MDRFSKTLRDHIQRNNIKIQSLSKASGVDRTLIQKMIKGDRIPADKEILEKLIEALMLSPRQAKELREAYYIGRIGEDIYLRHLQVKEMLEGFCYDSNISDISITTKYEHSLMNAAGNGVFYGCKYINQLLKAVLEEEASGKGIIKMIIQPSYEFLLKLLTILASESSLKIDHIFFLQGQSNETDQNKYNLNCIKNIAPLLTSGCEYTPHIYYEDISSHLNNASIFPYVIITGTYVITLTADFNTAILYQNTSFQTLFTSVFNGLKVHTIALVNKLKPLLKTYGHYHFMDTEPGTGLYSIDFKYSLYSQPCLSLFANRSLVEKYINISNMPLKERFIYIYEKSRKHFFHKIESGFELTSYFTLEGIDYFWQTGRFFDIPDELYRPFEKKDCLYILNKFYEKCSEGKIHSFLINKAVFRLPENLIVSAAGDSSISIFYKVPKKDALHYIINEKSLTGSLYSYLEFLKHSDAVYSDEVTLELLKIQLDIYTKELTE